MGEKDESYGSLRTASAASDAQARHPGGNPQVKLLRYLPACHDPNATTGREMRQHRGLIPGLETIGESFGPAANMIFGHAETAPHGIKAILPATLGR
jgi:hypothetical protein